MLKVNQNILKIPLNYKFVRPIYNPDINKYFTVAINQPIVAFY